MIDIKEVVTSNEIEFKCGFLWQNPPDKPKDTIFQDEEKSKVWLYYLLSEMCEHWSRRWIMLLEVLGATSFILSLFDLHI